MNKPEIVNGMAEVSGMTKKDSTLALEAFVAVVTETLASGDDVVIAKFGKFVAMDRAARNGVNPKTREPMVIAATKAPVFKASATFKALVKNA